MAETGPPQGGAGLIQYGGLNLLILWETMVFHSHEGDLVVGAVLLEPHRDVLDMLEVELCALNKFLPLKVHADGLGLCSMRSAPVNIRNKEPFLIEIRAEV